MGLVSKKSRRPGGDCEEPSPAGGPAAALREFMKSTRWQELFMRQRVKKGEALAETLVFFGGVGAVTLL